MFQVQVPVGAAAGQTLEVKAPTGEMMQVQIPAGVAPGGMFQVQAPAQQTMGGDIFQGADQLMVKQEFAALECCGCEAKNRYRISKPSGGGRAEGDTFLYINEESECIERICCSVNRSLTLHLHQGSNKDTPTVMSMEKPFHCQGCCFMRPEMKVYGANKELLGTVYDPFMCCTMDQQIKDEQGQLLFTTNGTICQLGLCCACCADVKFDVMKQGSPVAEVSKLAMDCQEFCAKTNRFVVDFKQVQDPKEKKLLLAAAMLLDLEYFEVNKNDS